MSANSVSPNLEVVPGGEPTLFDSLARLVPDELQAAYYRVLAHTRTLSPDDEMLRILEAMGVLALLTRQTPQEIAEERERFQALIDLHRQSTDEAQQKMSDLVCGLDARIAGLPQDMEKQLEPKRIAKLLGESLRQQFLQSGIPDTAKALSSVSTTMAGAQKELSAALRNLTDSHGGVLAQVENANERIRHSMENRVKVLDELLHEWKSDLLRIWIPLIAGASMLIGLFGGFEIQGCRDVASAAAATPTPAAIQSAPSPVPQKDTKPVGNAKKPRHTQANAKNGAAHER
jgi:predicted  nucleic acid-binding Zn-ribbon protein